MRRPRAGLAAAQRRGIVDISDLRYGKFKPGGAFGFSRQCPAAQFPENRAGHVRPGRGAHIECLRVQAGRDGRQEGTLGRFVQFLGFVEDQQIPVLATAAVAGAGQKLDARPAFEDDLLRPRAFLMSFT